MLYELKKMMHEYSENININKDMDYVKTNQIEILELKSAITQIEKKSLEEFNSRLDQSRRKNQGTQ